MQKVGPSRVSSDSNALLVVTKIGMHPYSTNEQVARLLDPDGKAVTKAFKEALQRKKLSPEITRLWKGLGVPEAIIAKYVAQCRRSEGRNHAYVVGVADPTSQLPPGSIFITGTSKANWSMKELFVTRHPCVEPKDGRMLPVVTFKPAGMTQENWDWLQTLHFGAIVFANPRPGERPLAELVASGDLDGDLFFICWHEAILQRTKAEPITDAERLLPSETTETKPKSPYDPDWLEKTQRLMLDAVALGDLHRLIGKLYNTAKEVADKSPRFMHEPDAISFARACKRALEMGKHGGKVYLPEHLHEKLPDNLQKFLVASPEEVKD
jgi:hypothetical protein